MNFICMIFVNINLGLKDIFYYFWVLYKFWLKEIFVVFFFEIFICIENGRISFYLMKGIIDVILFFVIRLLMEDEKEVVEYVIIVDLI